MNVIRYGPGNCEWVHRYLDPYISGELLVETTHEVQTHLDKCADCTAELETRMRLKSALKRAVMAEEEPPYLGAKLRDSLGQYEASRSRPWYLREWTMVAAAASVAILSVAIWMRPGSALSDLDEVAQNTYIQRVSASLHRVLRTGLGDHLHCTIARKWPENFTEGKAPLKPHQELGPDFEAAKPLVKQLVPAEFEMVQAHRCGYGNRRFVHFAFRDAKGSFLSVVIASKEGGEVLSASELVPALQQAGVLVYQQGVENYHVAGFESRNYFATVISDQSRERNLAIAGELAPALTAYLNGLKS
jgi:hypothetical protein